MPDRRSADDLSIEELEHILRIKKREARMSRLRRYENSGLRPSDVSLAEDSEPPLMKADSADTISYRSFLYDTVWRERTLRNRLLLAVEITAAAGLVGILIFTAISLRNLNQEVASVQSDVVADLPTPTATALITTVVLPGGHTPPTDPQGAQPNYSEVPQHLRPMVEQQFAGPVIIPTPGPTGAVRLRIPTLGVDAPIVQGDGWEQLKKGVGQHLNTADPGQPGNMVLSAHNDIYGELFRYLDQLQEGDEIIISTTTKDYVYRVAYQHVVTPDSVEVMEATQDPIITLISCYPYLVNSDRIVVVGELLNP